MSSRLALLGGGAGGLFLIGFLALMGLTLPVASLLVFPAWMPWMILGWLGIAGARLFQQKPLWPPLAVCLQ